MVEVEVKLVYGGITLFPSHAPIFLTALCLCLLATFGAVHGAAQGFITVFCRHACVRPWITAFVLLEHGKLNFI